MRLTKKDIRLFRIVSAAIVLVGLVVLLVSRIFGGILLLLGLFFLFTPYEEGDEIGKK